MVRTKKLAMFSLCLVAGAAALMTYSQASAEPAQPHSPVLGGCYIEKDGEITIIVLCDIDDICCFEEPTDDYPGGSVWCCPMDSVCVSVTGPDGTTQLQCSEKE